MTAFKKYIAEFVGTLVLVLFGCGSAVAANTLFTYQGLSVPLAFTTLTIAFAFGLCIVAMAYSIGNVSGCHVNPAVSVAMLVAGKMNVKDFIGYVIAQFAGALAGAFILSKIIGTTVSLGQNGYGEASIFGISAGVAVAVEIILTFVFVTVIFGVTSKPEYESVSGLVIGLSLTLVHIFGIPFTGTSVNPARSFGPAVLAGGDALKQLPLFIIAPVIGGVLAALFFTFILNTEKKAAVSEEDAPAEDIPEDAEKLDEADLTDAGETETPADEEPSGYDPVEEMQIEPAPESVTEAEAAAIEEVDSNAAVE